MDKKSIKTKAKFLLTHEKLVHYFDNGKIKYIYWTNAEGEYDGLLEQWHRNGNKRYEAQYKNDQLHGRFKIFFENGLLASDREYKNGKRIRDYWISNDRKRNS